MKVTLKKARAGHTFNCLFCKRTSDQANLESRRPRTICCGARLYPMPNDDATFRTGMTTTELRGYRE